MSPPHRNLLRKKFKFSQLKKEWKTIPVNNVKLEDVVGPTESSALKKNSTGLDWSMEEPDDTSVTSETLSGLAVLIVGAIVLANVMEYTRFVDSAVLAPPIVLIVVGGIIFLIAFLGCCGAIKENYIMLIAFAVLLAVIFVVELAVGIAASVSKDDFTTAMRESLRGSMLNYTKTKLDRQTWDNMHKTLKCCGLDSPRGWGAIVGEGQVPVSCCLVEPLAPAGDPPTCPASTDKKEVYQAGCYEKIKVKIKDNIVTIMAVGLGIAVIELAGIVLACCLATSIKKDQAAT